MRVRVHVCAGAVLTLMVQASSATVAIVSALAEQQLVSMNIAVAVVLGASMCFVHFVLITP